MPILWDVLLLFVGLGFAGIGAVNPGTAPLWFGAAVLCAIAIVIDAIRRRQFRRSISEAWTRLQRLRGPAAEHRRYANAAARTAGKIFQAMDVEPARAAGLVQWPVRWAAEHDELLRTARHLLRRLDEYDVRQDYTPALGELAVDIVLWAQRYWQARVTFWMPPPGAGGRLDDALSSAPAARPEAKPEWKRFWLKQLGIAVAWLEKHDV